MIKLQDINNNPNSLTSVPDQYLFTNAAKWFRFRSQTTYFQIPAVFLRARGSHLYYTPYAEDRYEYNADSDDETILWGDPYSTGTGPSPAIWLRSQEPTA